jgi:hypothetical protein
MILGWDFLLGLLRCGLYLSATNSRRARDEVQPAAAHLLHFSAAKLQDDDVWHSMACAGISRVNACFSCYSSARSVVPSVLARMLTYRCQLHQVTITRQLLGTAITT